MRWTSLPPRWRLQLPVDVSQLIRLDVILRLVSVNYIIGVLELISVQKMDTRRLTQYVLCVCVILTTVTLAQGMLN